MPVRILIFCFFSLFVFPKNGAAQNVARLEEFVAAALKKSPLLQDFENQRRANRLDSLAFRAALGPQISANSTLFYAPIVGGWGYDAAVTNGAGASAVVQAQQNFGSKKAWANQSAAFSIQDRSLAAAKNLSEKDLRKLIADLFLTALGDQRQADFEREMSLFWQKDGDILKKLTEKGIYRQVDLLAFFGQKGQQRLAVAQAEQQFRRDLAALRTAAGLGDTAFLRLEVPAFSMPDSLKNNLIAPIFLENAWLDSLRLRNAEAQIALDYAPKFSATADAGYNSSLATKPFKNFGASAGVTATKPLFDGHQAQFRREKIKVEDATRRGYRDFLIEQKRLEIAELRRQLAENRAFAAQLEAQIGQAKTLVEANRKLLPTGDARIADYLTALADERRLRGGFLQLELANSLIINALRYWLIEN